MFCKKCGKELPEDVKFCPDCGCKVGSTGTSNLSDDLNSFVNPSIVDESNISSRSRAAAAVLACPVLIGLGLLGLHQFYVGNKNKGITYLILTLCCWAVIPLIVVFVLSLIDFINILTGTFEDAEGKKLVKW